jgi:hypothetical protein
MRRDAWIELPADRADRAWDRFVEEFRFRPGTGPDSWPSFREPGPSITWRVREELADFNPWRDPQAAPYNLSLLGALRECVSEGEPVLALDWQHAAYEFYPHRLRRPEVVRGWLIPALPSAEYHLFVTPDHRLGSLGHPWEETVCVFGAGFLEAYLRLTPLRKDQIIRQRPAEKVPSGRRRAKTSRERRSAKRG